MSSDYSQVFPFPLLGYTRYTCRGSRLLFWAAGRMDGPLKQHSMAWSRLGLVSNEPSHLQPFPARSWRGWSWVWALASALRMSFEGALVHGLLAFHALAPIFRASSVVLPRLQFCLVSLGPQTEREAEVERLDLGRHVGSMSLPSWEARRERWRTSDRQSVTTAANGIAIAYSHVVLIPQKHGTMQSF